MSNERYVTFEVAGGDADGDIVAFHETERWQAIHDSDEWHEFVWQYADSHEDAVRQHDEKFSAWRNDVNAGRPEKETY